MAQPKGETHNIIALFDIFVDLWISLMGVRMILTKTQLIKQIAAAPMPDGVEASRQNWAAGKARFFFSLVRR